MSKFELYLFKIVKYGLYAILLTPVAFWPKALYGFMTPKFISFYILVEIVFGAWVILKLIDNVGNRASNIKFSWLTISLLIFTAISFISAFLGVDFSRSFWGIGARMTGLFAELHFFAWFLVLVSVAKSGVDFRSPTSKIPEVGLLKPDFDIVKYLNFSFGVSILVALTAFYQNAQWHLVYGYTIFSNPTFVAPYFLFHFFWGGYKTHEYLKSDFKNSPKSDFGLKWFFGAGTVLIGAALIMGQVRGATIGFLTGLFVIGIFLIFGDILAKKSHKIFIAALMFFVVLSVATIFIFKNSAFVKSRSYLDRIGTISLSAITAQTRILTWQSAFKGVSLLGVGPENFNYSFNANYNPRLLMYGGSSFAETWQDKPHNAFIEILTETGIIGGLAYIAIWLCVVYCLFKIFKKNNKFLALSLAAAFISYFGAVFFSFDSFGSWFGLFLFFAILILARDDNTEIVVDNIDLNKIYKNIIISIVILVVLFLLLTNYAIWRANLADADALRTFSNNPVSGIALFKKSLSYNSPYKTEYRLDLIASVGGAIEKNIPINNLEDVVNFILDEADRAIVAHPNNASGYTDMLRIYNILSTKGRDPDILAQAEQFGKKSLELSPNRQETLFYLARTALLKEDSSLAVKLTRQAVAVDPEISVSHWYLGLAYIADSQTSEGALEIKKALDLGYKPRNDAEKMFIKNLGIEITSQ